MFPVQTVDNMLGKTVWYKSLATGLFVEICEARWRYTEHPEVLFSLCAAELKKKKKKEKRERMALGKMGIFPFLVSLCVNT